MMMTLRVLLLLQLLLREALQLVVGMVDVSQPDPINRWSALADESFEYQQQP